MSDLLSKEEIDYLITPGKCQLDIKIEELEKENERLKKALCNLCDLKNHKDKYGKDDFYKQEQPKAWSAAMELTTQERTEMGLNDE